MAAVESESTIPTTIASAEQAVEELPDATQPTEAKRLEEFVGGGDDNS